MLRKCCAALLTLLLALTPWAATAAYQLPDLGNPADTALPPAKASEIGAQVVEQLRRHDMILDDPELSTFIQNLGQRLVKHSSRSTGNFHFFVVRDNTINAFALPGDYIGIQTGLITATRDVSELAAVMAHEIGHEVQHHIARQMQAQKTLSWTTGAAILAAIIAGGGSPEVAQAALGLGMSSFYQNSVTFTRQNEMEADHVGIRILAESGFDPNGMVTFFQRLNEQTRLYGNIVPDILLTHPVTSVRIAEARERAQQYPEVRPAPDLDYQLMRARTRVLAASNPADAVDYYRKLRASGNSGPESTYGYAVGLTASGHVNEALDLLQTLIKSQPDNVHYLLAEADALLNANKAEQAVALLKPHWQKNRSYSPFALGYANALIRAGQPSEARDIIVGASEQLFHLPQSRQLLADAAAAQGRKGEAYYQSAEYYRLKGDIDQAIKHLQAGLRLPNLDDNDRARMSARLETLKKQATHLRQVDRSGFRLQIEQSPAQPFEGCAPCGW